MQPFPHTPDWRRTFVVAVALTLAVLAALFVLRNTPVQAQGQIRLEIDKQLQGSDLIRVGQEMTFTIRIRNTGTVSVTRLPLLDRYNASILQLRRSDPTFSTHDSVAGVINWTDLTTNTLFGPLPPGAEIRVTTVFRAIRAAPETVNFAEIGAAEGTSGETGGGESDNDKAAAEGGRVIVVKSLPPGQQPVAGKPVTFTVSVRNDGAADLVKVPLEDVFSSEYLAFISANPVPSSVTAGRLAWDDVLPLLGRTRLRPNEVLTVTTVFTALQAFDGVGINRAGANGVEDEFQNQVAAPRQADIPVRILADESQQPTATTTPRATIAPTEQTEQPADATSLPTATTISTATELAATPTAATATPTANAEQAGGTPGTPATLPRSGGEQFWPGWWLIGILLVGGGVLVARIGRR